MSVSNGGVIGPDNIPDLTPAQSEQDEVTATFTSPGTHTTAARTTSVDVFIVSGGGGGGAEEAVAMLDWLVADDSDKSRDSLCTSASAANARRSIYISPLDL